jgi:hypothetical protein
MCRNIKVLRTAGPPPTDEEIVLAALQYVRKVSGYRVPSKTNKDVFDLAVAEIAGSTQRLLHGLTTRASAEKASPDD